MQLIYMGDELTRIHVQLRKEASVVSRGQQCNCKARTEMLFPLEHRREYRKHTPKISDQLNKCRNQNYSFKHRYPTKA